MVGWDKESPSTLYVNDPGRALAHTIGVIDTAAHLVTCASGFYRITYTWGDVVGWRLFNMTG